MKIIELFGNPPSFHPNIDLVSDDNVDIVWDLKEPLPFQDSSVDVVFISNISLVNISLDQLKYIISESIRILCKNGRLSIGYVNTKSLMEKFIRYPINDKEINTFRQDKLNINREYLVDLCKQLKFFEEKTISEGYNLIIFRKAEDINISEELFTSLQVFLQVPERTLKWLITHHIDSKDKYNNLESYYMNSVSYLIEKELRDYKFDKVLNWDDRILVVGGNSTLMKMLSKYNLNLDSYQVGISGEFIKYRIPEIHYIDLINKEYDRILIDSNDNINIDGIDKEKIEWIS